MTRKPRIRPLGVFRPVQKRRVYAIVRKRGRHRYRYPRLSLEGGALSALNLAPGQAVMVEYRPGEIRIRPWPGRLAQQSVKLRSARSRRG